MSDEEGLASLVTVARKSWFQDLQNFSGDPNENVEKFLKSIKSITTGNKDTRDAERLQIVRGKLTAKAGT
ncbi:unnamed protein product, partial [Didymodactylos carnosus]